MKLLAWLMVSVGMVCALYLVMGAGLSFLKI